MTIVKVTFQQKTKPENFGNDDVLIDIPFLDTGCMFVKSDRGEYNPGEVEGVIQMVRIRCAWTNTIKNNLDKITHAKFAAGVLGDAEQIYEVKSFERVNNQFFYFDLARVI